MGSQIAQRAGIRIILLVEDSPFYLSTILPVLYRELVIETQAVIEEAIADSGSKRIDDPIRMYLTQMGQIPLLTRKDEISLARKIEIARMAFRRKMLQSDYCARNAVDLFQQVCQPFEFPEGGRGKNILTGDDDTYDFA